MLTKVFPIKLKPGKQAEAEAIVGEFAPRGPQEEPGTLSFRVYRDPANVDYLLFVEHFADQALHGRHRGATWSAGATQSSARSARRMCGSDAGNASR